MTSSAVAGLWKKLTNKLPKPNRRQTAREPVIIPRDQHTVSRKQISENALKVLHRLNQAGFEAFLVGGGVRDILIGGLPKDFDVATDATPEEVRNLFRNSRIIGRRFKIVHVRFGRDIIEVTTFRGNHSSDETSATPQKHAARSESGMLLRDNIFGSVTEDAQRRDLTINALYYSSKDFCVYDYVGGLQDLNDKLIRIIGDPETRYREDPVRMLRVVRFAAKLNFDLETATEASIGKLAPLLNDIAPARLFDEVLKLFMSGRGLRTYALLKRYHLFGPLFPATQALIERRQPAAEAIIQQGLANTDARIDEGKPVNPAFLYAVILWPVVRELQQEITASGVPEIPALHQAAERVLHRQQQSVAIPRRYSLPMRDIWELQYRLPKRTGKRPELLLEHRYFRAGFDFLLLREQAEEIAPELGQWWLAFQESHPEMRSAMVKPSGKENQRPPRRRRRGPRKPRND